MDLRSYHLHEYLNVSVVLLLLHLLDFHFHPYQLQLHSDYHNCMLSVAIHAVSLPEAGRCGAESTADCHHVLRADAGQKRGHAGGVFLRAVD